MDSWGYLRQIGQRRNVHPARRRQSRPHSGLRHWAGISNSGAHLEQPGTRAVPSLRYLHGAPKFSETTRFADGDVGPGGGFTWDGRAGTLKDQARIPLLASNEMANRSPAEVVAKLGKSAYAPEFREAFGTDIFEHPERAFEVALSALDAFQQIPKEFYPFNSKYDAFLRGEIELSEQEERGVALFKDPAKGNCASCHVVLSRAGQPPVFTDYDFLNVGVPRNPRIAANADPAYLIWDCVARHGAISRRAVSTAASSAHRP